MTLIVLWPWHFACKFPKDNTCLKIPFKRNTDISYQIYTNKKLDRAFSIYSNVYSNGAGNKKNNNEYRKGEKCRNRKFEMPSRTETYFIIKITFTVDAAEQSASITWYDFYCDAEMSLIDASIQKRYSFNTQVI